MRRIGPILAACALLVGAVAVFVWSSGRSVATGASSAEGGEDGEALLGGYGSLGGGGSASVVSTGRPSAEMPGLDAGLPLDAGEGAPVPLGLPAPTARVDPAVVATSTFPPVRPRALEDEYDSANMVWGMIEARRETVRADLAEARRIGDQQLSARLAHQLELLEIGDRRMSGIVRELESQRVPTAPQEADPAHEEGAEGAPPL